MSVFCTQEYGVLDSVPIKEKRYFFYFEKRYVFDVGRSNFLPTFFDPIGFKNIQNIWLGQLEILTLRYILDNRRNIVVVFRNKALNKCFLSYPFLTYTVLSNCDILNFLLSVELNNKRFKNFALNLNNKILKKNYITQKGVEGYIQKRIENKSDSCIRVLKNLGNYYVKRYFNCLNEDFCNPCKNIFTQIEIVKIDSKYIKFRIYVNPYKWIKVGKNTSLFSFIILIFLVKYICIKLTF